MEVTYYGEGISGSDLLLLWPPLCDWIYSFTSDCIWVCRDQSIFVVEWLTRWSDAPFMIPFLTLELLWMLLDVAIASLDLSDGRGVELIMNVYVYVYELVTFLSMVNNPWCYNLTCNLIILLCSMNNVVNPKVSFCLTILLLCVFIMYNICVVG